MTDSEVTCVVRRHVGDPNPSIAELQVNASTPLPIDVDLGLPMAGSSVRSMVSELDLHELPRPTVAAFLRDSRRVLAPGASMRLSIADFVDLFGATDLARLASLVGLAVDSIERSDGLLHATLMKPERQVRMGHNPLVSILIAAYRPDFLDEALCSARAQSWSDLEIVVGDDSPGDEVRAIVQGHAEDDSRIRYVRYAKRVLGRGNYVRLFDASHGELVKYLNDDDLLHPTCVERMARCLLAFPEVTLVTSHRLSIDVGGAIQPDSVPTLRPVRFDTIIDGSTAVACMMQRRVNWIGEPTTTMFRRADIRTDEPDLLSFAGSQAPANADTFLWAHLLSQGDLVYLIDSMSSFRQHDGQRQKHAGFRERALGAWSLLIHDTSEMGLGHRPGARLHGRALMSRRWWSDTVRTAVETADEYVDAGDLDEAISALDLAVADEPNDAVVRFYRAQLALSVGDVGAAMIDLVHATTKSPHYAPAQEQLAVILHESGDSAGAQQAASKVLLHHPS